VLRMIIHPIIVAYVPHTQSHKISTKLQMNLSLLFFKETVTHYFRLYYEKSQKSPS
jgi:hypothetical protein